MTKKRDSGKTMSRRGLLESGAKIIPSLAIMGIAMTSLSGAARADCFGSCHAACADNCVESCKGDCMGDCKGSCGGCDTTCTGDSKGS